VDLIGIRCFVGAHPAGNGSTEPFSIRRTRYRICDADTVREPTVAAVHESVHGSTNVCQPSEAAQAAAERRWNAELLGRYSAMPSLYAEIVEAIE
jgi:hypothetical protein